MKGQVYTNYITREKHIWIKRVMACTYCQTSRMCKCGYNCADCFRAKELYSQILTDVHNPQVDCTIIRRVKSDTVKQQYHDILPRRPSSKLTTSLNNDIVVSKPYNATVGRTQDFLQEAKEKEKRKVERQKMFKERQKQPKTTSFYCFKNMQHNEVKCCNQCFQIIEQPVHTSATK